MTPEEYKQKRKEFENSFVYNIGLRGRRIIHPILLFLIKIKRIFTGFKIHIISKAELPKKKPIIFCITHIGKFDIEICAEVLKKQFYLLSGDFENVHGTSDGNFIELEGIIYLNKFDKEDMARSKETSINILKKGGNIMWFPEGIWNLSPNLPVLPIPFGIIEVAKKGEAVIIPIAIEQYVKEFYIAVGKQFLVDDFNDCDELKFKLDAVTALRDQMASLKFDIWQSLPTQSRQEIPDNYFETFIDEKLNQWHGFTYEEVIEREFKPKDIVTPENAFSHLNTLIPNKNNAFLFNKRNPFHFNTLEIMDKKLVVDLKEV